MNNIGGFVILKKGLSRTMEKQTQQSEGHESTRSLPPHRVTPKSGMSSGKKQAPEQWITRSLQVFDQLKPHIIWVVIVAIAIYNYFHPSDTGGVIGFLVLMAAATGAVSLPKAIDFLRGRSVSLLPEEKETDDQSGATEG